MTQSHQTAAPASHPDPSGTFAARVLVVDDSPTVLAYTCAVLTEAGYEVHTRKDIWVSGEVASFHPDLILVDVNMGSCRGTSVVKALLDRSFAAQAAIVLYSTLSEEDLEMLARECGAHGYIRKTNDPETLRRHVRRLLVGGPDAHRRKNGHRRPSRFEETEPS